jgi:long-chain fatty acid transport protein
VGVRVDITPRISMNLGYMHAFERTITEKGTNLIGQSVTLESTLSEDSVDFSFTWRF